MSRARRTVPLTLLCTLLPPVFTASLAAQELPPRIDGLLSPAVREAFASAAQDRALWDVATRDAARYLRQRGIEVPPDLHVSFLDVQREGDWIRFGGIDEDALLDMYCPKLRTGWEMCAKVIRACEQKTIAFCRDTTNPNLQDPCFPRETVVDTIDTNCYFVCDRFIWEKEFTLSTRPPFPPLPLVGR